MKTARRRVDVNLDELDRVLDGARQAPLSEDDYEKLKEALHALAAMLVRPRRRRRPAPCWESRKARKLAPGRNRRPTFPHRPDMDAMVLGVVSSRKIAIPHAQLKHGDRCPSARKATYTGRKSRKCWYGLWGSLRWRPRSTRSNGCVAVPADRCYTAQEPEGVGPEKYDETAAAIDRATQVWQRKRRSTALEQLQGQLGIPLPAATQWKRVVEEAAELLKPARDELIRQAAQGEVVHNDDTSMRVLHLTREPSDERTGCIHQRIVSTSQGLEDCAVLHRTPACRREPRRRVAAAGPTLGPAHQCATRSRAMFRSWLKEWRFYWQTARPRKKKFDGSSANFPDQCRLCTGNAGRGSGHDAKRGACLKAETPAVS